VQKESGKENAMEMEMKVPESHFRDFIRQKSVSCRTRSLFK